MDALFKALADYGLQGALIAVLCYFMNKMLETANEREKSNRSANEAFIATLTSIQSSLAEHCSSSVEYRRFVRDEHKEMISKLTDINSKVNFHAD